MSKFVLIASAAISIISSPAYSADFIVKDSKAASEIIISKKPTRSAKLAASELQLFIKKITGADISILTAPGNNSFSKIYIGKSSYTEKAGVTAEGQATYKRGYRGRLSDHVWNFVNRVAIEVEKTHPDKTVNCLAYGSYLEPPLKIKKLNKNVLVGLVGGRRPKDISPEGRKDIQRLRNEWLTKTDNKIYIFENYPFIGKSYLPIYISRTIAESLNNVKGISMGEDIWFSLGRSSLYTDGYGMENPIVYHLNAYSTARFYWGGKKDYDQMMAEYFRLFYRPAEKEMKAFIEYCEAYWPDMTKDKDKISKTFELLEKAVKAAPAESVYAKRILPVVEHLKIRYLLCYQV